MNREQMPLCNTQHDLESVTQVADQASVGQVPSESTPAFPQVFPQPEQLCKSYSTTGDSSFAAPLGRSIIIYIQLVIKAQDLSRITC